MDQQTRLRIRHALIADKLHIGRESVVIQEDFFDRHGRTPQSIGEEALLKLARVGLAAEISANPQQTFEVWGGASKRSYFQLKFGIF